MGDLLNEIIEYIIASGFATAKDSDIFKDFSPKEPDEAVMVYEYNGSAPAPFTNTSVRSIQIVCRSKKNVEVKPKIWGIYKSFAEHGQFITLGQRKCLLALRNTPIKIGVDEKNRNLWAFNMGLTTNFD